MCAPWVNLEVPINCVLLEHWNKYVFPFWGHSARAQWAPKLYIIRVWYIFPFLGGMPCVPHKLCIIRTL